MTARAEAGAAVRRLVHEYQSTAAFQRQRLRGVVARYRGLDLVIQAHAVFAADLSLALPDGATLDTVAAATDTGVWQSVGHTVSDIPSVVKRLRGRIAEAYERITTIDRELTRLEKWDGQATYDAAMSELNAINAVFAAEEQAGSEQGQPTATHPSGGTTPVTPSPSDEMTLDDVLLALAREEGAGDGWGAWQPVIPAAPSSLAWMAAEIERHPLHGFSLPEEASQTRALAADASAAEADLGHTLSQTSIQFGDARGQRQAQRPPSPIASHSDAEVSQLPLF